MIDIFHFLSHNKEWIFSGIGVLVIVGLLNLLRRMWGKKSTISGTVDQIRLGLPLANTSAYPPYLFTLPNGETIDPLKVDGIEISAGLGEIIQGHGLKNVCYIQGNASISFYSTYSLRKARKVARKIAHELNQLRGYRV
jgi:hypothetical protein